MGIYGLEHFMFHIIKDWSYEMGVIEPIEYSVTTRETTVIIKLYTPYESQLTSSSEVMKKVMAKFQWWFQNKKIVIEFAA